MLPLALCIVVVLTAWIAYRPVRKLERFCAAVSIGESASAVRARAGAAGFTFDVNHARSPVVLVWVDNFPGRAFCQLTMRDGYVGARVFFAD